MAMLGISSLQPMEISFFLMNPTTVSTWSLPRVMLQYLQGNTIIGMAAIWMAMGLMLYSVVQEAWLWTQVALFTLAKEGGPLALETTASAASLACSALPPSTAPRVSPSPALPGTMAAPLA